MVGKSRLEFRRKWRPTVGKSGWNLGGDGDPSPRARQEPRPRSFNPGRTWGGNGLEVGKAWPRPSLPAGLKSASLSRSQWGSMVVEPGPADCANQDALKTSVSFTQSPIYSKWKNTAALSLCRHVLAPSPPIRTCVCRPEATGKGCWATHSPPTSLFFFVCDMHS